MSLQYHSTRGGAPALDFEGVLLAGLAKDGGLYLPQSLPSFSTAELQAMRGMSYSELATTVIAPFVEGSIDRDTLSQFCLLYTSPSPRDLSTSRMPSSA